MSRDICQEISLEDRLYDDQAAAAAIGEAASIATGPGRQPLADRSDTTGLAGRTVGSGLHPKYSLVINMAANQSRPGDVLRVVIPVQAVELVRGKWTVRTTLGGYVGAVSVLAASDVWGACANYHRVH